MAHLPDTPYTRRRRTGQCCRSDRRRAPNIRHRACGRTCVRTVAQGDGMARGGGGAARQRQLRSTLGAHSCTGMASFGSVAAHRHRGHICDLRPRRRRSPTVRTNVSGSQIRGRFVISVTTAPRRPGRAVFGATSDRDDIRGSTRGSQIRDGWFTSVTSASALLSRKFGVVHICDLRVGAPLPKVRRT